MNDFGLYLLDRKGIIPKIVTVPVEQLKILHALSYFAVVMLLMS